jgi:hypothetical protein
MYPAEERLAVIIVWRVQGARSPLMTRRADVTRVAGRVTWSEDTRGKTCRIEARLKVARLLRARLTMQNVDKMDRRGLLRGEESTRHRHVRLPLDRPRVRGACSKGARPRGRRLGARWHRFGIATLVTVWRHDAMVQ